MGLSTVRDPEEWFYSAVSQWCTNFGAGTAACRLEGLSYEKLLEMGWWSHEKIKTLSRGYLTLSGVDCELAHGEDCRTRNGLGCSLYSEQPTPPPHSRSPNTTTILDIPSPHHIAPR